MDTGVIVVVWVWVAVGVMVEVLRCPLVSLKTTIVSALWLELSALLTWLCAASGELVSNGPPMIWVQRLSMKSPVESGSPTGSVLIGTMVVMSLATWPGVC